MTQSCNIKFLLLDAPDGMEVKFLDLRNPHGELVMTLVNVKHNDPDKLLIEVENYNQKDGMWFLIKPERPVAAAAGLYVANGLETMEKYIQQSTQTMTMRVFDGMNSWWCPTTNKMLTLSCGCMTDEAAKNGGINHDVLGVVLDTSTGIISKVHSPSPRSALRHVHQGEIDDLSRWIQRLKLVNEKVMRRGGGTASTDKELSALVASMPPSVQQMMDRHDNAKKEVVCGDDGQLTTKMPDGVEMLPGQTRVLLFEPNEPASQVTAPAVSTATSSAHPRSEPRYVHTSVPDFDDDDEDDDADDLDFITKEQEQERKKQEEDEKLKKERTDAIRAEMHAMGYPSYPNMPLSTNPAMERGRAAEAQILADAVRASLCHPLSYPDPLFSCMAQPRLVPVPSGRDAWFFTRQVPPIMLQREQKCPIAMPRTFNFSPTGGAGGA